jgi:hypothetical protein
MERKKNLITFLILIRMDTVERIENLLACIRFLSKNLPYKIKILECAPHCNGLINYIISNQIEYDFVQDNDPILHRTLYINKMASDAATPFIAVWDCDVIVPINQIQKSIHLLETGQADFVYPYDKFFLDTTPIIRKLFLEDENIETLNQNLKKMREMYAPNPLGGAFMANLEAYKNSGMENEDFYGWGMEDGERFFRWKSKGLKVKRVSGHLFHLSHHRGINSMFHNPDQGTWKRKETLKVRRLNVLNVFE